MEHVSATAGTAATQAPQTDPETAGVAIDEGYFPGEPLLVNGKRGAKIIGWSRATWNRRKHDDPDFPKPVAFGPNNVEYFTPLSIRRYVELKAQKASAKGR